MRLVRLGQADVQSTRAEGRKSHVRPEEVVAQSAAMVERFGRF